MHNWTNTVLSKWISERNHNNASNSNASYCLIRYPLKFMLVSTYVQLIMIKTSKH